VHEINDCADLLLTFSSKMPQDLERCFAIIESLYTAALKDTPEIELNYSMLHLGLVKIFMAVKSKNKEDSIKECDKILKIMKHHDMSEYGIMSFEIVVSLLLFSLDPELIDQEKMFLMKKKFVEMAEVADDPSKK
jgi:hypothetical protein